MRNHELLIKLKKLSFEQFLWVIFIVLSLLNIYGDEDEKKFLKTNNSKYKAQADKIFEFTLIITLFIYIYFFIRNYDVYKSSSKEAKKLLVIKLLGSSFLIAGIILLLFFQKKQNSFIGSPSI